MGSSVSRPTGRTSFSVISAKASAALLCKSTLSEKDNVFQCLERLSGEEVRGGTVYSKERGMQLENARCGTNVNRNEI